MDANTNPWNRPSMTERTDEILAGLRAADERAANKPGMDPSTGRCLTCDGRYCGTTCHAREGYVWVVGYGWGSLQVAETMAARGRAVQWDQQWTEADGGHIVPREQ